MEGYLRTKNESQFVQIKTRSMLVHLPQERTWDSCYIQEAGDL